MRVEKDQKNIRGPSFYFMIILFCLLQRIRVTPDQAKSKSLLMEWKVPKNSVECPYTILFYGAFFCEVHNVNWYSILLFLLE